MSTIKETVWLHDNEAESSSDLLEGIAFDLDKYVHAVARALPKLPVEDGVIHLEELWIETALPHDLLRQIVQQGRFRWPPNVERIQLDEKAFVERPADPLEEEAHGP